MPTLPYRNKSNYAEKTSDEQRFEHTVGKSLTVPNETMSIQEILDRYAKGQRPDEKRFIYLDVEDISLIDRFHRPARALDYTDLEELADKNQRMLDQLKKVQENIEKEKQDVIDKNPDVDKDKDGEIDSEDE